MKGLLKVKELEDQMPLVCDWLRHAEATRQIIRENYGNCEGEDILEIAAAENVLTQIDNLRTYPVVRAKLNHGQLRLHAWVYEIESGEVYAYDPMKQEFVPPESEIDLPTPTYRLTPNHSVSCEWLPQEQSSRIYRGSAF
jgi:carbonic anhydrase